MDNVSTITTSTTTSVHPSGKQRKENEALSVKGVTTPPPDGTARALRDMCFLATAYSANIGGTGSLTGTGPNLVIKGVLARLDCTAIGRERSGKVGQDRGRVSILP